MASVGGSVRRGLLMMNCLSSLLFGPLSNKFCDQAFDARRLFDTGHDTMEPCSMQKSAINSAGLYWGLYNLYHFCSSPHADMRLHRQVAENG